MSIRNPLFILLLLFFANLLSAQEASTQTDYDYFIKEGQKAIEKEDFNEAIDYFKAAKVYINSDAQKEEIDEWLDKANQAWRQSLVDARDRAKVARNKAEEAEKIAIKEAKISDANRLASLADIENDKGNYADALYLSNEALNMGISVNTNIPLAHQAFGNAVYQLKKVGISSHQDNLLLTVLAPNGASILTSGKDKATRLWTTKGDLIKELVSHNGPVFQATYAADSKNILTCSADRTAKIWDKEGNLLYTFKGHKEEVLGGRFSQDGTKILTWSRDNTAKLWKTDSTVLATFRHKGNIYDAFFSADEQKIITRSSDFSVKVWDTKGTELVNIKDIKNYITHASATPNGDLILTCTASKIVDVWNEQGQLGVSLPHEAMVEYATFSKDGSKILSVSRDNTAYVWTRGGQLIHTLKHKDLITEAHFSKEGKLVLTASKDHAAIIWDLENNTQVEVNHTDAIIGARFSENELKVVTFSADNTARLWSKKGGLLMTLAHQSSIAPQFSADGQHILTSSDGKIIEVTPLPEVIFKQITKNGLPEMSKEKREKFGVGD